MRTEQLYLGDSYLRRCEARVLEVARYGAFNASLLLAMSMITLAS
jgi:Ser-tRNA(Ala) deacylase AlaX